MLVLSHAGHLVEDVTEQFGDATSDIGVVSAVVSEQRVLQTIRVTEHHGLDGRGPHIQTDAQGAEPRVFIGTGFHLSILISHMLPLSPTSTTRAFTCFTG